MSLLGNTFLRITSKKIQQRVGSEARPSVTTLFSDLPADSPLRRLGAVLRGLNEKVDEQMGKLLVADALDDVMLALRTVRPLSLPCRVMLKYRLIGQRSHDRSSTMVA